MTKAGAVRAAREEAMHGRYLTSVLIIALSVGLAPAAMIYDNIDDYQPDASTYYESSQSVNLGNGYVSYWVAEDFYTGNLEPGELAELTSVEWIGKFNNRTSTGAELIYTAEVIILSDAGEVLAPLPSLTIESEQTGLSYSRQTTTVGTNVVDRFTADLSEPYYMLPDTHYYVGVRLRTPDGTVGGSHAIASVGDPNPAPQHSQTSAMYQDDWFYQDWTLMSSNSWWADQQHVEYAISLNGEIILPEPTSILLLACGVLIIGVVRR